MQRKANSSVCIRCGTYVVIAGVSIGPSNVLAFSRWRIQTIPTYQKARTAAMPEGQMAARHVAQGKMPVGSNAELGSLRQ